MKTENREGENYLREKHVADAAFQSPAEKKKNQEQDALQNRQEQNIDEEPATNTTLGKGNQMEGQANKNRIDSDKLNP
ncbi:MAG: hypothetical protein REI78_14975 [Pedobacter sp.]|nr:hypothetical protein [Pedobacter sp.]MDQ8054332.1 hypothetical protein [Pedobacter sp.]